MFEAKKIISKYKNLLDLKKNLQEELKTNKTEETFLKNLCKLGDKNEKARRLKKVTKTINKINKDINKIDRVMQNKKQYFEVTVSTLLFNLQKKLNKDFPCEGTRIYMRKKKDMYNNSNQINLIFGVELLTSKVKYDLPVYTCNANEFITKEDVLNLNQGKYKINLLTSGLIGDNYMQFADGDTQELFWKLIETDLQTKINSFKTEKKDVIRTAKNDYKNKVGEFIAK